MSTVDLSGLTWRKSSHSGQNSDNGACIEVAFTEATSWRKSSLSGGNHDNDACVEVAFSGPVAALRDSKSPAAGTLAFPAGSFAALLGRLG